MTLTQMRYFMKSVNGAVSLKLPPVCISLSQLFPSPWPIWKRKRAEPFSARRQKTFAYRRRQPAVK